nr:uncharacterized protein LOC127329117 [Lolium perenne]
MASRGSSARGGGSLGGGDSPPRPPVFRTEAERRKWVRSEGARKRSARGWTNRVLTPPGKLAGYALRGEGSSSGGSRSPPSSESEEEDEESEEQDEVSEEEEEVEEAEMAVVAQPATTVMSAEDYVHDDDEEEAVVAQVAAVSAAEARARWRREEADAVRQVQEYEAAGREERVCRIKLVIVELDDE